MNRTLLIAILFLGGIILGIFFTWPKYQDFQQVSFELETREQELENKETYFKELAEVKADLIELKGGLLKVEAALPLDPQLPVLYDFLQTTAAFSGMSVRNISSSVGIQAQALLMRTIPVALELSGSFDAIKEFVSRLETASRMVALQSLNISGGADTGRFNIILQLHAYSY